MKISVFPVLISVTIALIISVAVCGQIIFAQDNKTGDAQQTVDKSPQDKVSQDSVPENRVIPTVDEKYKQAQHTDKTRDIIKDNKEELSKQDEPRKIKPLHDSEGKAPDIMSLALPTIIILTIMLVCYVIFRKFLSHSRLVQSGTIINVLAKKQLSSKHNIYLVEVGRKIFLIGQSKDNLEQLGEFSNPDDVAILRAKCPWRKDDSVDIAFRERLNEELKGYEGENVENSGEEEVFDNLHSELEDIKKTVNGWRA